MDELAYQAGIDPLQLRLINYAEQRRQRGQSLHLQGAARRLCPGFREASAGRSARPEPRSMRDGNALVGWGMATGIWEAFGMPTAARATLTADGKLDGRQCHVGHRHRHLHDPAADRVRRARRAARRTSPWCSATRRCPRRRRPAARGRRPRQAPPSPSPAPRWPRSWSASPARWTSSPLANLSVEQVDIRRRPHRLQGGRLAFRHDRRRHEGRRRRQRSRKSACSSPTRRARRSTRATPTPPFSPR